MVSRSGSISRRDSYDHRPYQGSPSYPYPYRYPPYPSRRHYSGPPPPPSSYPPQAGYRPSGYHSREPSSSSSLAPQRSNHSTPSFTNNTNTNTIATTTTTTTTTATTATPHSPKTPMTTTTPSETPATFSVPSKTSQPPPPPPAKYSPPASRPPSYPSSSTKHNAYHHYHHNSHYSPYISRPSSPLPAPPIKRVSWAPEQENELERYHAEQGKLHDEEDKILTAVRKSRFELEFASWDTSKLERQLELVQTQWEENGMEDLIKQELAAKLSGKSTANRTQQSLAIS